MGVTQQDIADALHLPLITVHRAINNSGYVSKELKARILAYAEEAHYVPHKASQVLKRNRMRKIALFSSSLPHYFWNDIRTGITIGAEQIQHLNYRVNYHMIAEGDSALYRARLAEEIEDGVEAVAFVNQWIYDMKGIIGAIDAAGVPYVTLNVDAPESRRLCHIGPDYRAGGRLAAEFIGKMLQLKRRPRVLVVSTSAEAPADSHAPDINRLRYEGFRTVLHERHEGIAHEVALITTGLRSRKAVGQIERLLAAAAGSFDAIYLIAAFNTQFIEALEKRERARNIVVLHDLDSSSNHLLERNLLTAVIYQNPILQGYYAVKILENLLESGHPPEMKDIDIVHSVVLSENRDIYRNHYLFAHMID
jgi:LacI family transcriptional regulator